MQSIILSIPVVSVIEYSKDVDFDIPVDAMTFKNNYCNFI